MKRKFSIVVAATVLAAWGLGGEANAMIRGHGGRNCSYIYPWHGEYYDATVGMPAAVVVPPRMKTQTNYSSGVGGTTVARIGAQYQPMDPGPSEYRKGDFRPTPAWPTSTEQFGTYYIRGPRP